MTAAPLKIGFIYSYSGARGHTGRLVDAAFAAFMKLNGDTVAGRPIQVLTRDEAGIAPARSEAIARELIEGEKVEALAGVTFTPNAEAVSRVSLQTRTPLLITMSAASGLLEHNPFTSRWSFSNGFISTPLADWAVRNGLRTACILYQDYTPGRDAMTAFDTAFRDRGGKVLASFPIPTQNGDFAEPTRSIMALRPAILFVSLNHLGGSTRFMETYSAAIRAQGIHIVGTQSLVTEENLVTMGDNLEGVVTSGNYSRARDSAINRRFVEAFRACQPDIHPDFTSVAAFDAMTAIYRAAAAQDGRLDPERTMDLIKAMRFESPRGPIIMDPATRDVKQNIYLRRVERRNGEFQNVDFETFPLPP